MSGLPPISFPDFSTPPALPVNHVALPVSHGSTGDLFSKTIVKELMLSIFASLSWSERVNLLQVNRQAKADVYYAKSKIEVLTFQTVKNYAYIRTILLQHTGVDRVRLKRAYPEASIVHEYLQGDEFVALKSHFKNRVLHHLDLSVHHKLERTSLIDLFASVQMAPPQLLNICGNGESMSTDLPGVQIGTSVFCPVDSPRWFIPPLDFNQLRVLVISSLTVSQITPNCFKELLKRLPLGTLTTIHFAGCFFNLANWEYLCSKLSANQTLQELVISDFSIQGVVSSVFEEIRNDHTIGEREILLLLASLNMPSIYKISLHVTKQLKLEEIKDFVRQKMASWPKLRSVLIHDFYLRTRKTLTASQAVYLPYEHEHLKIGPYADSFTKEKSPLHSPGWDSMI